MGTSLVAVRYAVVIRWADTRHLLGARLQKPASLEQIGLVLQDILNISAETAQEEQAARETA